MSDRPKKPPVEIVRRPAGAPAVVPAPRPVVSPAPRPVTPKGPVVPRQVSPVPVRPAGTGAPVSAAPVPRPVVGERPSFDRGGGFDRSGPPRGRGGPGGFPRPARPPGPPPTADQINALARRERVPARIAKGELEGKMKCRIWKKLHAEEAKRFDQAYTLMEKTPGLELAEAFGVNQAGMSVEEFRERRARVKKKEEVKVARTSVDPKAIDGFLADLVATKAELTLVLGERTVVDTITAVEPVAFQLEKSGRLEKLQVVALCKKALWEKQGPHFERDAKLAQKPLPVARQPARRPVSDPRPFLEHSGKTLGFLLRNGLKPELPLRAVGPFDVLLGEEGEEIFVPLHGVVKWEPKV
ncbi:MAG: hypothetical protein JNK82_08445 [Myxococcaceae bacterium]|nr:hypothetical protein [Myxococcaceae bacterium]